MHFHDKSLEEIWHDVPPNYYQNGVKNNVLQRTWHTGKLRATLSLAPQNPTTILDVGCASGWFLSELAKKFKNAKCTGIDVYDDAIEYGKKRYKKLELIKADGHKIPFKKASFDFVICNEVLEHVEHPEKVLLEIKRVLKPGGVAVIEMDSGNWLFRTVWHWWTHMRRGVWRDAHIHVFTAQKLERMIKKCGFKIEKKKGFNFSMAVAFRAIHKN